MRSETRALRRDDVDPFRRDDPAPRRPLRITVVEPRGHGGMIHYAYQLAGGLAGQGCDVELLTSRDYELAGLEHPFRLDAALRLWRGPAAPGPAAARGRIAATMHRARLTVRRMARAAIYVREWISVVRHLERERPDVAIFGTTPFAFETLFLRRLRRSGLRLAQVCHEFDHDRHGARRGAALARRARRPLQRAIFMSFDALFVHGERNRDGLRAWLDIPLDRLHVIDHGNEELLVRAAARAAGPVAPLRERLGIDDRLPLVLFFGNLNPSKGVADLLRAFALLAEETPSRLVIAGHPSKLIDAGELCRLADELGTASHVHFDLRYIPLAEVGATFEDADVVALPYLNASQSGVLQVAYAFGRPVVATRVGGLPEAVEDGGTGILVSPGAPAELASAIARILGDDDLRRRMGERARELSRSRYSWSAVALSIRTVLDEWARPAEPSGRPAGPPGRRG